MSPNWTSSKPLSKTFDIHQTILEANHFVPQLFRNENSPKLSSPLNQLPSLQHAWGSFRSLIDYPCRSFKIPPPFHLQNISFQPLGAYLLLQRALPSSSPLARFAYLAALSTNFITMFKFWKAS
ncbi:hypothetical protein CEXT_368881 [Caerostris extrusa]|uniref:Uncharacterized protein n=1 Tax=Caerostris extrusa TaxID=172846 RepID=A0AAV4PAQ4_CAEEX|nr:hypothetical protein CEXT_368881 [Caerostris extrusa]